ncbi:uncharacterized protein LOC118345331, partial [Juglans regia]|uniref:Uncharacterized protein LOC118345331 n=1 Tax=Juglans regia TaxID=51240 RepID=A0A6P9E637_JUGRE
MAGGVSNEEVGGKLWIMWSQGVLVSVVQSTNQFITVNMTVNNRCVCISFVYAKCLQMDRRELWNSLSSGIVDSQPWIVVGDFNVIRNDQERRGGRPRPFSAMEAFNKFIDTAGLSELRFEGNQFSWCNNQQGSARRWARLDRTLTSVECITMFPEAYMQYLPRTTSDHAPILIKLEAESVSYGYPAFKFHQTWVTHDSFLDCVANAWEDGIADHGMARLARKLKKLKQILQIWNREVFGNTGQNIQHLEDRLSRLEIKLQEGNNDEDEQDYLVAKSELDLWQDREEIRLQQQAKQTWLKK